MALNILVPLIALIGAALSAPVYPVPLTYVALSPIPENIYNQVQDTKSGEYAFGYAGGPVAREEAKTSDGVIRGAYSYVDAYGIVQYYRYIADDDGFRVVGTNIPTEVAHNPQIQIGDQLKVSPENSSDKPDEHSSNREKRSALNGALESTEVIPTGSLTVVTASSVPTATSSQRRVQIHKSFETEIGYPVEASEPVAIVPEINISVKNAETIPIAVAASVPTSTSSQSRYQVHNGGRTEFHVPDAIPVKTVVAVPAVPVELGSTEVLPAAVAAAVATSTSSQSRYQVHNSLKTESHTPEDVIDVKTVEQVPAVPIAVPADLKSAKIVPEVVIASVPTSVSSQSRFQVHSNVRTELHEPVEELHVETVATDSSAPIAVSSELKSVEAIPIAIGASLPISTSSQSRFQVHNSLKTKLHEPIDALRIQTLATVPVSPIGVAVSVPVATSSKQRLQSHENSEALPASETASISDQVAFQKGNDVKVGYGEPSPDSEYELRDLELVNGLQLANAFSEPSLSRHHVGVGLGVVPSPLVAYHTFTSPLYA